MWFDLQRKIDFAAIGLTEPEAHTLEHVRARLDVLLAEGPITEMQRSVFLEVLENHDGGMGKVGRMIRDRVVRASSGDALAINDEDPWATTARIELATIANREAWVALVASTGEGAKPTKKWQKAAAKLTATIGNVAFVETVRRWFELVKPRSVARAANNWYAPAMADANGVALRNLVWACATISGDRETEVLAVACGDLAVRCFTKIPGIGALSQKAGNACIYVLSQLPGLRAVSQLSRLSSRLRYKQAIALVEKAKLECAKRVGMEPIDLEEISMPTFGLDVTGRARVAIGEYTAELATDGIDAALTYWKAEKRLKSIPAALKTTNPGELADLKSTFKDLSALVPTLKFRLERWLLEPRTWTLADLRTRYLDHPLAAPLARRMIYATPTSSVIFLDGYPLGIDGKPEELADDTVLALWHPLGRPAAELAKWRALLASLDIVQPIKQLERELYLAGDEAATRRSMRFANRIMRQHQFAALCRERGWDYRLQGQFDGANNAIKRLPGVSVELEVGPANAEITEAYIFLYVTTGMVRFFRDDQQLVLGEIPARYFSEILRDVDLFVTVCAR